MADEQLSFDWANSDGGRDSSGETVSGQPKIARAAVLAERMQRLAERHIYVGTSSWKYPGWLGQIYDPQRYTYRGRVAQKRFNDRCLAEYAEVFRTVCGDFVFYQFPSERTWKELFDQLPDGFRFSLKVPEDVTVERFPDLPRYGKRAGKENDHFLDAALVRDRLLAPLEPYRDKLGTLIFEFGTIRHGPMRKQAEFAVGLDHLLSRLPCDQYQFSVEVRNKEFLAGDGDYLSVLRQYNVAHCFNSWTRMPSVAEQMRIPGIITADHVAGRFLLKPGRTYRQAVEQFEPYERLQDPYPEGRDSLRELISSFAPDVADVYAFVNNRFEGSAIETIERVTDNLDISDNPF
jgi:uncharacterized protein YecE (DUF72 family)